jgi:hypothetical protein
MNRGDLSEYFVGAAAKVLRDTEVNPEVSRGHELQGISQFRKFLGETAQGDVLPITYTWLSDDEPPTTLSLYGTWYNSRRNQPHRAPEYRFYYPAEAEEVVYRARAGDTLILCQPRQGDLLAIFCERGSSIERQLFWLFGLDAPTGENLSETDLDEGGRALDLVSRHVLELIGVDVVVTDDRLLDRLTAAFGERFPGTREFSDFARLSTRDVDGKADPDSALLAWMDIEERLFMTLEKHLVGQRLLKGFVSDGKADVESFVQFSLGVQNRRKSRAGWAFANHIEALLSLHGLKYTREATTEKRAGPDFLFPGESEYRNPTWPAEQLTMLAAKTSCKDRWRQVLAEADRIPVKHLLTLEPGISLAQTAEMKKERLQLVVPAPIHSTYLDVQRSDLMDVRGFIELAARRQDLSSN